MIFKRDKIEVGDKVKVRSAHLEIYNKQEYSDKWVRVIEPTEATPKGSVNVDIPHNAGGGLNVGMEDITDHLQYQHEDDSVHKGLRFNEGKKRFDLVHPWAHEQMVSVLTIGANKYLPRNWESGMSWSSVMASLKRHLNAWEKGEDYDEETGELHMAHLACNAHFLTAYYKIYPQGDDRPHEYLKPVKIGLDIDEVLADFIGAWEERFGKKDPEFWNFDKDFSQNLEEVKNDKDFWLSIKPLIDPKTIPFEPHCYITSRVIPTEWTEEWLQKNGFPSVKVYTVGIGQSKVDAAKESGIDIFVDDRYENFVELNRAGVCTFMMSASHNQRYNVGYKRINELKDLMI